jgi:hypothetical protein
MEQGEPAEERTGRQGETCGRASAPGVGRTAEAASSVTPQQYTSEQGHRLDNWPEESREAARLVIDTGKVGHLVEFDGSVITSYLVATRAWHRPVRPTTGLDPS